MLLFRYICLRCFCKGLLKKKCIGGSAVQREKSQKFHWSEMWTKMALWILSTLNWILTREVHKNYPLCKNSWKHIKINSKLHNVCLYGGREKGESIYLSQHSCSFSSSDCLTHELSQIPKCRKTASVYLAGITASSGQCLLQNRKERERQEKGPAWNTE